MSTEHSSPSARRTFLKTAGVLAVGAAAAGSATGCDVKEPRVAATDDPGVARVRGFDRTTLDAVATAVLPESLGPSGIRGATDRFVAWADGYDPVAEEMHGYGYSDVRYLPADPAPAWRAQLQALDLLAQKTARTSFAQLPLDGRRELLRSVLRSERSERLPAPLGARHVALALLSHWSSGPDAWNLALGAQVNPMTCRTLDDAVKRPLPLAGGAA